VEAQTWRQHGDAGDVLDGGGGRRCWRVARPPRTSTVLVGLGFTDDGAGDGRNGAFGGRRDGLGGDAHGPP
jgi:hypothetical protein